MWLRLLTEWCVATGNGFFQFLKACAQKLAQHHFYHILLARVVTVSAYMQAEGTWTSPPTGMNIKEFMAIFSLPESILCPQIIYILLMCKVYLASSLSQEPKVSLTITAPFRILSSSSGPSEATWMMFIEYGCFQSRDLLTRERLSSVHRSNIQWQSQDTITTVDIPVNGRENVFHSLVYSNPEIQLSTCLYWLGSNPIPW